MTSSTSKSHSSRALLAKRKGDAALGASSRTGLLPAAHVPSVERAKVKDFEQLDAVLAIVPESASASIFATLPEQQRLQDLHARSKPSAAAVRATVLGNRRQTLVVLGYLAANASAFERLSLAGRLLKEVSGRKPTAIGLMALGMETSALQEALEALLAAALAHAFRLPAYQSAATKEPSIDKIFLLDLVSGAAAKGAAKTVDIPYALAAARGTNLVRWLGALPPNILDSGSYRRAITTLARSHGLGMHWLGEAQLRRAGANAFLAVAAGNDRRDAGIAHLTYRPRRGTADGRRGKERKPDIALIGKGILFDTGGVNLKPHRSMLDMHTDMSGSAVALATLLALAELRAPIAADAWLAITENHIGPTAYRPQEVVRASNGVTIQVIHTDAEGRMVLADTLALAGRTHPRFMLDFATLTGACVYSLTERMSGVLANRPQLAPKLVEAGRTSGERVWNFPFDADYDSDLESKIADIVQCSVDGKGDHILAARFLNRFVPKDIPWAHVDLSSATRTGGLAHINTDITGFGVRYALELIIKHRILDDVGLIQ